MDQIKDVQASNKMGSISRLVYEIDDFCGTPPQPFPPRSHGLRDAMIAVAIYNLASEISDGKVRDQIQTSVDRLYNSAGKQMAG